MLEAYLDKYHLITIKFSKLHYDGIASSFCLKNNNGEIVDLKIIDIFYYDEFNIYKLILPIEIEIGQDYYIYEEHGFFALLKYRYIVKEERFAQEYYCDNDLGVKCSKDKTIFNIWAPTAKEVFLRLGEDVAQIKILERKERGLFTLEINENLAGAKYRYLVNVNGQINDTIDPYAYGSTINGQYSIVVNWDELLPISFLNRERKSIVDSIIYEISINDITKDMNSGINQKGKYLGLCEEKSKSSFGDDAGMSYIASLGVTDVQIMPFFDFATIDEEGKISSYNWGYDPLQFNVPEGSYGSDNNPLNRIRECQMMIQSFHNHQMGVVMDVVYNHVYNHHSFSFDKVVPYLFFRYDENFNLSNGSFCHNDIDSNQPMVRKFIVDSLLHWMKHYGVDSFRFDLMGIIDIDTMLLAQKKIRETNPNALIYGEGWNMPTALADHNKASMQNHRRLSGIAFFNDRYREIIKGGTWSHSLKDKGFISGNFSNIGLVKNVISGSATEIGFDPLLSSPEQSINYIESHDNRTIYDKLSIVTSSSEEEKIQRIKFANLLLLISQGVPFFHSGQEFGRTKKGIDNSYNLGDEINKFDYQLLHQNIELITFFKAAIRLRKKEPLLRLSSSEEVAKRIHFEEDDNLLIYYVKGIDEELQIFINPSDKEMKRSLDDNCHLIFDETGNKKSKINEIIINPISIKIIKKYY